MHIIIIGSGYVGLVSGACFAELGHEVVCVDVDAEKIRLLNSGQIPFYEPGLQGLVVKNVAASRLSFSEKLDERLNRAQAIFICVGTPPKENGQADLRQVYEAAEEIGKGLRQFAVVVTKSTVSVGTAQKIKKIIRKNYTGDFAVASCPEFLKEGSAIDDFLNPDRVVIGTENDRAREQLLELHQKFTCPKMLTNLETAEMIKYAANAFLATKISFINEIANICENVGASIDHVAEGMGLDKRIGAHFLRAGVGYGGSCFPKDVRALHHVAGQYGYPFQLLKAVVEVNNQQRWLFYKKIRDLLGIVEGKTIALWGLAFKANTDDIRESVAIDLAEKLVEDGATVKVYDPAAMKNAQKILGGRVNYCFSAEFAVDGADALLILTEWDEFKSADLHSLGEKMRQKIIFDGRNIFEPNKVRAAGFNYISVGRN